MRPTFWGPAPSLRPLLFLLLVTFLCCGCGETREYDFVRVNDLGEVRPPLSGQVAQVEYLTELEAVSPAVLAQQPVLFEGIEVPAFVTDFRFTGFNAGGRLVYGPVERPKADSLLLEQVPVETVSLRVELLVDVVVMGGASLPLQLQAGGSTRIENPTYRFPGLIGEEIGGPGPVGPPGAPGGLDSTYGTFVFVPEEIEISDGPPFPGPQQAALGQEVITVMGLELEHGQVIPFEETRAAVGVSRVQDAPGLFQVGESGDYLLTYTLSGAAGFSGFLPIGQQVPDVNAQALENPRAFLELNGEPVRVFDLPGTGSFPAQLDDPIAFYGPVGSRTYQVLFSLEAGDELALTYCSPCLSDSYLLTQGHFTVLKIGESSTEPPEPLSEGCPPTPEECFN